MSVRSLFAIASLIAIAAVAAVAYIVLPERIWSIASIAALTLFGFAVGFALYAPFSLPGGSKGGDAAPMASIGPMALIVSGLLGWSALSFVVALTGRETITWAMMVVSVAGFIISTLILHATAKIVDQAAAGTAGPSARALWRAQVGGMLSSSVDPNIKIALNKLAEKIQYASSDVSGSVSLTNSRITEAINHTQECLIADAGDGESILSMINGAMALLAHRESELMALRSKV